MLFSDLKYEFFSDSLDLFLCVEASSLTVTVILTVRGLKGRRSEKVERRGGARRMEVEEGGGGSRWKRWWMREVKAGGGGGRGKGSGVRR